MASTRGLRKIHGYYIRSIKYSRETLEKFDIISTPEFCLNAFTAGLSERALQLYAYRVTSNGKNNSNLPDGNSSKRETTAKASKVLAWPNVKGRALSGSLSDTEVCQ